MTKRYKLLVVAPTSGVAALRGQAVRDAVQLAIQVAFEERRIPRSWAIDIAVIDEAATSGPSSAVSRKLKKEGAIVAALGALLPATAEPLGAAVSARGAALIVVGPGSPPGLKIIETSSNSGPTTTVGQVSGAAKATGPARLFVQAGNDATAALAARWVAATGGSAAVADDGTVGGKAFAAAATSAMTALGVLVSNGGSVPASPVGALPAFVTQLMAGTPSVVIVGSGGGEGVQALSTAVHGVRPAVALLVGGQDGERGCFDALVGIRDGDYCVTANGPDPDALKSRAFREDFAAAGFGSPTIAAASAYDGANLILDALAASVRQVGEDAASRDVRIAVSAALRAMRLDGVTGASTFADDGARRTPSCTILRRLAGQWSTAVPAQACAAAAIA